MKTIILSFVAICMLSCSSGNESKVTPALAAFQVQALPLQVYSPGDRVLIKGSGFFGTLSIQIAGVDYPVEFSSESEGSFILPTATALVSNGGTKSGKLAVVLKGNDLKVPLEYVYLAGETDFPLITSDASKICDSEQFYDAKGELTRGTKECKPAPEICVENTSNCFLPEYDATTQPLKVVNMRTIDTNKASMRNTLSIAGVTGTMPICKDGEIGCYVVGPIFRTTAISGLGSKVVSGETVATIAGTVTLPSNTKVLSGITYGVGGTAITGNLGLPSAANVLFGSSAYGDSAAMRIPALTLPAVGKVLIGTTYGVGGTGSSGTLTLPAVSSVLGGSGTYGDPSAPQTPTSAAMARPVAPAISSNTFNTAGDTLTISWATVSDATGYIVLFQTSAITFTPTDTTTYSTGTYSGASLIYVGAGTSTSYSAQLSAGNNYYIAIYAYQANKIYSATPSSKTIYSCAGLAGGTWVAVPGDAIYGTSAFCVQKYAPSNVLGFPTSQAGTAPWVNINQTDSITTCNFLGAGYHLITNPEWMTIAANLANVGSNWSSTAVGLGNLRRGHSDSNPNNACAADASDANAYVETTCTGTTSSSDFTQRRTSALSNGAVVWDFGGNVHNWVNYYNAADKPTPATAAMHEYNVITGSTTTPRSHLVPLNSAQPWWTDTWSSAQGIGRYWPGTNNSGGALFRGGRWDMGASAGAFTVNLSVVSSGAYSDFGFRCAWQP